MARRNKATYHISEVKMAKWEKAFIKVHMKTYRKRAARADRRAAKLDLRQMEWADE